MPIAGFDRKDPAYCPTVSNVPCPGLGIIMDRMQSGGDFALAYRVRDTSLALRQPKSISHPVNEHVSLLLKALSTRLAGKHLVTAIIQCSDFYTVDEVVIGGTRAMTPHQPMVTTSQKQGFLHRLARLHPRRFGGEHAFVNRERNDSKVSGSTLTRWWIWYITLPPLVLVYINDHTICNIHLPELDHLTSLPINRINI
ncbi:hypothetical protein PISMIDRAFT_687793 [Pisolithus microcarpus 441]|uniref:Unplaced genomic scaffold scaffold_246, whole genome shotgun sequence n=1 Tax=Pisolithus microcarpus 441 TaxID=765257 RepID=A0A0C9YWR1_9AGAM|nr:hypothetical protein BKA83DRAFT_687793 [Pisolithus microcarpus]KIK14607.1 hypothetical protein PISMIDRAFT_687793 [Pisolithus microcarpus 441]